MKCPITIRVNGRTYRQDVEPRLLLVHFLRDAGLTDTKIGCDTSQCGACTVSIDGIAVKSCATLAVQADATSVTTIEGRPGPERAGLCRPPQAADDEGRNRRGARGDQSIVPVARAADD